MSGSYERVFQLCPECGAQCGPTAERCWMCDASLTSERQPRAPHRDKPAAADADAARFPAESRRAPGRKHGIGVEMPLLIFAASVIEIGLVKMAPGFAILLPIVIIPALIALPASVEWKTAQGSEPTLTETIGQLASKILKTAGILLLVGFGILIAAAVFCFVLLASNSIDMR